MSNENSKLAKLFQNVQERMRCDLTTSSSLLHPVDNGDNSENTWINFFNQYLPKRYKASKATVIDSNGDASDQLDIVIFDHQYSYLVFQDHGITYIPAESVYAAFEVRKLFKNPCSQAELNKIVPFGFSLQRQKMVFFLPSK